ncbi:MULTISPECIES: transketolase C-terminal domain-containing protein, partial [unclassified Burkholderia]|uniref:transketolase C-terminal domain-containing protein n=1 Tax=unclassified Burkholderia TaxID=2613784 RepID=UPI000FA759E5
SRKGRMVIVAENHTVIGGLGEAVATALLAAGVAAPFRQIALPDAYLAAGALPTLHDRYGISASAMRANIRSWVE